MNDNTSLDPQQQAWGAGDTAPAVEPYRQRSGWLTPALAVTTLAMAALIVWLTILLVAHHDSATTGVTALPHSPLDTVTPPPAPIVNPPDAAPEDPDTHYISVLGGLGIRPLKRAGAIADAHRVCELTRQGASRDLLASTIQQANTVNRP
jgi:hypothetical protein